jgi:hypothetical protein
MSGLGYRPLAHTSRWSSRPPIRFHTKGRVSVIAGIVAAVAAGSFALIIAIYNSGAIRRQEKEGARRAKEMEELRASLQLELQKSSFKFTDEQEARKAELEYRYEARKKMYERFEPLLFQLFQHAEYALDRIKNLTKPEVWEELQTTQDGPESMGNTYYELTSTLYGLFAPLVVARSMSRRLTLLDLSLEPRIHLQYLLASKIYASVKDDFKLAGFPPENPLPYDPFAAGWRELRKTNPAKYWWQGLTMGRLENVLDMMTIRDQDRADERLMSFGEFERLYLRIAAEGQAWERKALGVAANPLYDFSPAGRPVYWRMLIVQARLYQALLLRTDAFIAAGPMTEESWRALMHLEDREEFDWKVPVTGAPTLEQTIAATDDYLQCYVRPALQWVLPTAG